jgi:anaerobic magnesium-protoporphyrin IX monomethyl ester cyclase
MDHPSPARPRLLMLHPKTLVDSWPMPVDTLGEIIKVPSLVYPILAATVRNLPVELEIFDGYVSRIAFRDYRRMLARADYLAITVMTPLKALDTELTIRLARRLNPRVRVIVGGNHATAFPERWLASGADYAIVREGEQAFPALIERLLAGAEPRDVPGVVYRDAAGAVARGEGEPVALAHLDDSPLPDWDRFDLSPYELGTGARGLTAAVEVSRGCPHRCDFCNINKFWGYRQRYKTAGRVLSELDRLHRRGVRKFMFADDNFGGKHGFTCGLFEDMVRRGYGFEFGAFIRGDTVFRDPGFAALAARAGLRLALVGIETLDEDWLASHHKGVRADHPAEMFAEIYQRLHRAGVFVVGLFIEPDPDDPVARPRSAGAGFDGHVCDFHYSADLLPQKNSALYDDVAADRSIELKDMFYHDWNMPSMRHHGRLQRNHKSVREMIGRVDGFALRALVSPNRMLRRWWWRHLALAAERLVCTTGDDLRRYRWAKSPLPHDERQRRIVGSVINDPLIEQLATCHAWRSPLGLRNGLWSPPRPPALAPEVLHDGLDPQLPERGPHRAHHAAAAGLEERDQPGAEPTAVGGLAQIRVRSRS